MRKITKRGIKKKLDAICSEIVRRVDKCVRCGKDGGDVTLHCAHIFSRKNMSTRWDLDNLVCLCYRCHYHWAHPYPVFFTEWAKIYLGEIKYEALKARATAIKKWTLDEMISYYGTLKRHP